MSRSGLGKPSEAVPGHDLPLEPRRAQQCEPTVLGVPRVATLEQDITGLGEGCLTADADHVEGVG